MLTKKISFGYSFLFLLAGIGLSYLFLQTRNAPAGRLRAAGTPAEQTEPECTYKITRIAGFKFIKPLLSAEQECESPQFMPLKNSLTNLVQNLQNGGVLTSASVYLRVFEKGEWMSYNGRETFSPGSLIKVPVMMTYLRESEENPSLLQKEILFEAKPNAAIPTQTFNSQSIQPGHKYTIGQLLQYMIAYSDNNATFLLNKHVSVPGLKKTFTDLGLAEPNVSDRNFQITASDYSIFIKSLFNSSYLSEKSSEKAMALLSQCSFDEGMVRGLPKATVIVHKFGESGDMKIHQLHETGIIYVNNIAYLLTIMTKGPDLDKLPEVLAQVSKLVYENIAAAGGTVALKK